MNRVFLTFLDRLVERFTTIIAGVVSSRVESLRAEVQAEQQSQLEDLARRYESDGKITIAQTLRERARQLTCVDLAGDAVDMMATVASERLSQADPGAARQGTAGSGAAASAKSVSPKLTAPRRTGADPSQGSAEFTGLPDFSAPVSSRRKPRNSGRAGHSSGSDMAGAES